MTNKCFAAIDLGTNSCRLLICDEHGKQLCKESSQTRLGEGMYPTMCFTPEAMERGVKCFYDFKQIMNQYPIARYRAIATAGCRMAKNSADFIRQVYYESLIPIEVIDGYEEARLNLKGSLVHVKGKSKYVVLYDLGGGSTEITLATNQQNPKIIHTISIPWGARNAAEAFQLVSANLEQQKKLQQEIIPYVEAFVQETHLKDIAPEVLFLATSSTPLRLAAMINQFGEYKREQCDGLCIRREQLDECILKICSSTQQELAKSPYIGEKRSHIFIAGCTIFKTIYDGLSIPYLTASLKSAVDGIVEELIEEDKNGKVDKVG